MALGTTLRVLLGHLIGRSKRQRVAHFNTKKIDVHLEESPSKFPMTPMAKLYDPEIKEPS